MIIANYQKNFSWKNFIKSNGILMFRLEINDIIIDGLQIIAFRVRIV